MPTINGRFYSAFGKYSAYQSLAIQRARMSEANDRSYSAVSTLTSAFSDASVSLSQGLASLAAKAAVKRMSDDAAAKAKAQFASLDIST